MHLQLLGTVGYVNSIGASSGKEHRTTYTHQGRPHRCYFVHIFFLILSRVVLLEQKDGASYLSIFHPPSISPHPPFQQCTNHLARFCCLLSSTHWCPSCILKSLWWRFSMFTWQKKMYSTAVHCCEVLLIFLLKLFNCKNFNMHRRLNIF